MTENLDGSALERELDRLRERERRTLAALGEIAGSTSVIAHDLKNAGSAVHLALKAAADALGVDAREALSDLVARLGRVERAVRRTLAYATPLEPRPEACDAGELLRAAAGARDPAEQARVDVEAPPDLELRADREHVLAALGELLDNALRAAPQGRVRLSARRDAERVALAVEDDGPGFPASVRAAPFEPFAAESVDGMGTGLALCRRLVEASGGEVAVGDAAARGARVTLSLPAAPAH